MVVTLLQNLLAAWLFYAIIIVIALFLCLVVKNFLPVLIAGFVIVAMLGTAAANNIPVGNVDQIFAIWSQTAGNFFGGIWNAIASLWPFE